MWHRFSMFFQLGGTLDALRGPLEGRRGTAGAPWGPLEGPRGHRRTSLGGPRGVLGESLGSLERAWGIFGAPLERPWGVFGAPVVPEVLQTLATARFQKGSLEHPWGVFAAPLGVFVASLGDPGGPWSDLGASLEPQRRSLERPGCVFGATAPARTSRTHGNHVTPRCKHYVSLNTLD